MACHSEACALVPDRCCFPLSVNRALHPIGRQQDNEPLGLAPMTEIDGIARIAKPLCPPRCLKRSLVPEQSEHFGRKLGRMTINQNIHGKSSPFNCENSCLPEG
jgi:hypothetical protein